MVSNYMPRAIYAVIPAIMEFNAYDGLSTRSRGQVIGETIICQKPSVLPNPYQLRIEVLGQFRAFEACRLQFGSSLG